MDLWMIVTNLLFDFQNHLKRRFGSVMFKKGLKAVEWNL